MNDTAITLNTESAVELAELLEFLCDWFDHDRARLDASMFNFACGGYYTVANLRDDCRRFADRLQTAPTTHRLAAQR